MSASTLTERKLTELDFARLKKLSAGGAFPELAELLDDVDVVEAGAISGNVVTMYASVLVFDAAIQRRRIWVVCHPADADPAKGFVSVLSPVGMCLIGLEVGASASWRGPRGEEHVMIVEEILFQPEANGTAPHSRNRR